jgi:hypothetical protein
VKEVTRHLRNTIQFHGSGVWSSQATPGRATLQRTAQAACLQEIFCNIKNMAHFARVTRSTHSSLKA